MMHQVSRSCLAPLLFLLCACGTEPQAEPELPPLRCSELNLDCGGTCGKCAEGRACGGDGDCQNDNCLAGRCAAPTCADGRKNGSEVDTDCGGTCGKCAEGRACGGDGDCQNGNCLAGRCAAPTCSDGRKNGSEVDTDCGGTCGTCAEGRACLAAGDCASGYCIGDRCAPPACGVQNLVLIVGGMSAHGYNQLLFPHPDSFAGREGEYRPAHFMQVLATGGAASNLGGSLLGSGINYTNPPAMPDPGFGGAWAAGERFKRIFGVDNQGFGGFRSANVDSRAIDTQYWGADRVPANATLARSKKFLVIARETPWIGKHGLRKATTIIEGGRMMSPNTNEAKNHWLDTAKNWTLMAAVAVLQAPRSPGTAVLMMGNLGNATTFYGPLPGAPAPLVTSNATDAANKLAAAAGVSATDLLPTDADRLRYGFTGNNPSGAAELRERLIMAAKALRRGLTAQVVLQHGLGYPTSSLFTNAGEAGVNAATAALLLANLLNAFMDDLMAVDDLRCPHRKLGDNTVIAFVGDTPQSSVSRQWADPSVQSEAQNRLWVMSNGFLSTGAFGGDRPRRVADMGFLAGAGEAGLYDLTTGDLLPFDGTGNGLIGGQDLRTAYGETAAAAVLYAIVRGRLALVQPYYSGPAFPVLLSKSPPPN